MGGCGSEIVPSTKIPVSDKSLKYFQIVLLCGRCNPNMLATLAVTPIKKGLQQLRSFTTDTLETSSSKMAQVSPTPKTYDVVIVGSGAGGGVAAQVLANAGAKICLARSRRFLRLHQALENV